MNGVSTVLLIVLIAGIALGIYALAAPRAIVRDPAPAPAPDLTPLTVTTDWTTQAGEEFANLSESDRCDLVFAVAALDDERSHRLLIHALGDPSDAVALASAHVLQHGGRGQEVERFAQAHPGARADALTRDLALLE